MVGCQLRAGAMRQAKRNEGGRGLRRRSGWSWVAKDQNRLRLKGQYQRGQLVVGSLNRGARQVVRSIGLLLTFGLEPLVRLKCTINIGHLATFAV